MLAARWTWRESSIAIAPRVHAHLLTLATAANRLRDEAAAQRTARRLTEAGMRAHLVEFLARTFGPAYRRLDDEGRRGLIRAIETVRAQGVRKIDPADGAAAIMAAPPRDLATALLEIPLSFAGLTEAEADALREKAFATDFPESAGQIAELRAVLAFTVAALRLARSDAMRSADIDQTAFDFAVWGGTPADAI